jgi:hypothetical protein
MEWQHSSSSRPHPKKSAEKVLTLPRFLGIKIASSSLIIFHRTKLSTGVLLISAGVNKENFVGKTPREGHHRGLVLAQQCHNSPVTCNPEKLAYLAFQYLDHPPYSPDLAVRLSPVPWTKKNN